MKGEIMEQKQYENDVSSLIEALIYKNVDDVWKEYVEAEKVIEARIYWRSVFFETLNRIHPDCNLSLPKGKEFANMVVVFAEPFSN